LYIQNCHDERFDQSQHYAGTAFDSGQALSAAQRNRLRSVAQQLGVWVYVEPASLTPTWVHTDRRQSPSACSGGGYPTLRRGSRSVYVLILQDALNTAGFAAGELDGAFGSQTESALRSYQRARSLSVDGVAGCAVWRRLMAEVVGNGRKSGTLD
jgi:hypothetical protein